MSDNHAITVHYGSRRSFSKVGLYFSVFFLRLGTIRDAGGAPICSRAMVFTASTAVKRFDFFLFATALILP